jgi:hypothetical protein
LKHAHDGDRGKAQKGIGTILFFKPFFKPFFSSTLSRRGKGDLETKLRSQFMETFWDAELSNRPIMLSEKAKGWTY